MQAKQAPSSTIKSGIPALKVPVAQPVRSLQDQLRFLSGSFSRPWQILRGYSSQNLQPDLIAGATVAVIMLPQAIAFALIAELPPQAGLYTAIVASIIGGLWGCSNQLQTGPTNTTSLLTLSVLLMIATPGTPQYLMLAGMLALLVGLLRLLMGIARLGVMVNFVSDAVIIGFTAGAGFLIFANQLRHLLRLPIPSTPALSETLQNVFMYIGESHLQSLVLGLIAVIVILILKRINRKIPGPLVAMILTSILVWALDLPGRGVNVVAGLPQGLPPFSKLPFTNLGMIVDLLPGAVAVASIGLVETMSIARVIASQTRQPLDSDQEFIGQGLANIACGLFSGHPASGSFTRSAVNFQAGARTSLSSVFAGLMVLFSTLLLGPLTRFIPLSALAGVLILTAVGLVNLPEITRIWRGSRGDRLIMLITFGATLFFPLEYAVLTGIVMSLAYYLLQTSTPRVREVLPDADFEYLVAANGRPGCQQMSLVEILGDLYFGAVHHIEDFFRAIHSREPHRRFLLLRLHSVEHCDISGIHALEGIVTGYRQRGGDVYIARYREPVLEIMRTTGFYDFLGADHFLNRDSDAIGTLYHSVLDPAVCVYECPVHAFKECLNLPKRLDLTGELPHTDPPPGKLNLIDPMQLWKDLHAPSPPIVIDVREPREYHHGHIPGSRLIPLPELLRDIDQIPKKEPVILVCRGGRRSARAAWALSQQGFDRVRALRGGMLSWEAARLLEAID